MEKDCVISGGSALDIGLTKSMEEKLGIKLLVPPQPQIVTALGAAIIAEEMKRLAPNQVAEIERTNLTRESLGGEL